MLRILPARPRQIVGAKHHFAFIASQYNPEYTQGLVNAAARELNAGMPAAQLVLHQVPGSWEIPVAVQEAARAKEGRPDVIIAFGVVLQGATRHADLIARTVTDALMRISLESAIPVIHAVLHCEDEAQARQRCLEEKTNRGAEAARAAMQMAQVMAELRGEQR